LIQKPPDSPDLLPDGIDPGADDPWDPVSGETR
jgi:hypothetical protein